MASSHLQNEIKWKFNEWMPDSSTVFAPLSLCFLAWPIANLHSAVNTKLPSAVWTRMHSILHAINAKRYQATSSPTSDQNQPSTSQPCQRAWVVSDRSHYSCIAIWAQHRHRRFSVHGISHNNSSRLLNDCGLMSSVSSHWRSIALRRLRRWIASLLWWIALLWWVARLLRIGRLTWRRISDSLVGWRFVRHLGFLTDLERINFPLLENQDAAVSLLGYLNG